MPPNSAGLTITNPLVLYRSLIATNRIKPDPAQHRLALHLQQLYERLIDYEPSIEYSQRLQQLSRVVDANNKDVPPPPSSPGSNIIGTRGLWNSLLAQKEKRDSLALTRVLTSHEAAMNLQSPKGLMLHGEVGTGKSMLIDLFADCLPNRKKKRWHFNTFMLDTFSRLEALRKSRLITETGSPQDDYSLLWLARDLIETSPILFLDEFQLPDRAASKILSNLMSSFFQLGGVLVATSNRMPEELAKAAGMEFARPISRLSRLGWSLGLNGVVGRDDGPGQKGEFAQFLEVLRARCEVWEMEGKSDYRRMSGEEVGIAGARSINLDTLSSPATTVTGQASTQSTESKTVPIPSSMSNLETTTFPKNYLIQPSSTADPTTLSAFESTLNGLLSTLIPNPTSGSIPWQPATLTVYGRKLLIPRQHTGIAYFTFPELCGTALGPADYITIASTYHTIILTSVPILTLLQKNEARRLITLLDAMYEARCRLLITAEAGPDEIFFPEPPATTITTKTAPTSSTSSVPPISSSPSTRGKLDNGEETMTNDAVYAETYAEIHQDLTSPFRPNISSYSLSDDALEDDPPNRVRRPGSSYTDERKTNGLDFANVRGLTGEDEVFAVKRAQSRIWEMCSAKWWARGEEEEKDGGKQEWWRPLPMESRHWEKSATPPITNESVYNADMGTVTRVSDVDKRDGKEIGADSGKNIFAHGASPFRTVTDAPPKIAWTHIWGTVKWGKRAGAWGKGVEGLDERKKEKVVSEGQVDEDRESHKRPKN